jgi:hypothetical protein
MARILVAGLAKSATTALWSKIANSYPWRYHKYFEGNYTGQNKKNMICKQLIGQKFDLRKFAHFDKIIWIVRDLRDRLISYVLYRVFDFRYDDDVFLRELLVLRRQKETDPDSVSLMELARIMDLHAGIESAFFKNDADIPKDQGIILTYENFVDARLEAVEQYLNRTLRGSSDVPKKLSRVARTKAYGFWRDWFTAEDIDFYKPLFLSFMERYGCDDDWTMNEPKRVDPSTCSEYVLRLANERRTGQGLRPLPPTF